MKAIPSCFATGILAVFAAATATAETVYVTDQLSVGLHEDKSVDSPIIKVINTNTALKIIKRDENMSYVREPEGGSGWVDNSYVMQQPGATNQAKTTKLMSDLAAARSTIVQLRNENKALQQQFKSERFKAGRLNIELAELRKRIGQNNDNASLYRELERLEEENRVVQIQLAKAMGPAGADDPENLNAGSLKSPGWNNVFIYVGFTLLTGIGFGLYIMDRVVRRRHGGLRL